MNNWFFYFLKKAIAQRRGRFIISSAAVALTVSVITALVTLSLGVREKIGRELRQYGANMVISDASGNIIEDLVASEVRNISRHIKGAAFQVFDTALVKDDAVEVIGIETERMTGYRLQGRLPKNENELMVGINLREVLNVSQGRVLKFNYRNEEYIVTALFEKGSDEDSAIVMPLESARALLGIRGVNSVLVNGDIRRLKDIEDAIRGRFPFLQVKTLRQVAVAEERILGRIQLLMLMVTVAVLFSAVIALGSTMGANVIERMEEIGLMKSLGATGRDVRNFFMSEAALYGLAGAIAGYLLGIAAAETVSKTAFGSFVPVNVVIAPAAALIGIFVAAVSTYFPVRVAMKVVPAQILRGE